MSYSFDRFTHIYDVRQNKAPVRVFKVGADAPGSHRPNLCGNIFSDDGDFILCPGAQHMLHKISVEAGVVVSSVFLGLTPSSLLIDQRDSSLLAAEARCVWAVPKSCYLPK